MTASGSAARSQLRVHDRAGLPCELGGCQEVQRTPSRGLDAEAAISTRSAERVSIWAEDFLGDNCRWPGEATGWAPASVRSPSQVEIRRSSPRSCGSAHRDQLAILDRKRRGSRQARRVARSTDRAWRARRRRPRRSSIGTVAELYPAFSTVYPSVQTLQGRKAPLLASHEAETKKPRLSPGVTIATGTQKSLVRTRAAGIESV
jgi:hypothetical protein